MLPAQQYLWTPDLSLEVQKVPVVHSEELLAGSKVLGSLPWLQTVKNNGYSMRFAL